MRGPQTSPGVLLHRILQHLQHQNLDPSDWLMDRPASTDKFSAASVAPIKPMKSLLTLLIAMTVLPCANAADASGQFKFGIFAPEVHGQADKIANETLTLPYKFEATGFRWGIEYFPADSTEYSLRVVIYLPSPPSSISGTLEGSKDSPTIVKTRDLKQTGRSTRTFYFEKGDPMGEWKIEVFIDGKLARTFRFQVVPEK